MAKELNMSTMRKPLTKQRFLFLSYHRAIKRKLKEMKGEEREYKPNYDLLHKRQSESIRKLFTNPEILYGFT